MWILTLLSIHLASLLGVKVTTVRILSHLERSGAGYKQKELCTDLWEGEAVLAEMRKDLRNHSLFSHSWAGLDTNTELVSGLDNSCLGRRGSEDSGSVVAVSTTDTLWLPLTHSLCTVTCCEMASGSLFNRDCPTLTVPHCRYRLRWKFTPSCDTRGQVFLSLIFVYCS